MRLKKKIHGLPSSYSSRLLKKIGKKNRTPKKSSKIGRSGFVKR